MERKFANNQVTLTTGSGEFSEDFVKRAVAFALEHGLQDDGAREPEGPFMLAVHTPAGPITARPAVDADAFLGFWLDRKDGEDYTGLSTSEYQVGAKKFATHVYGNFSDDSPTCSIYHSDSGEGEPYEESDL